MQSLYALNRYCRVTNKSVDDLFPVVIEKSFQCPLSLFSTIAW